MLRIEVDGDICLSRPRPTQGCRAVDDAGDGDGDDDDDDDDDDDSSAKISTENG
jgi:hypothetical protein